MSNAANKLIQAAAGNAGEAVYVDDVFSTYLYDGNRSTQTITNDIDLSGEGGLVWIKGRDASGGSNHRIYDTARGANKSIIPNTTAAETTHTDQLTSFNSNGFSIGASADINWDTQPFGTQWVAWTFRKAEGFCDIVTYTGDGTAGRTVNHNLGSVPGFMVVKKLNSTSDFTTYHRSMGATKYAPLNDKDAYGAGSAIWNNTEPTATQFTVGDNTRMNNSGDTYVAYLFAHDAQDFGENSGEAIIKCGSYTGNSGSQTIDVGFEAQWVLIKNTTSGATDWFMVDVMRGIPDTTAVDAALIRANEADAEQTSGAGGARITARSNGFGFLTESNLSCNRTGETYIYVAIRRPHKPASEFATTDLFDDFAYTDNTLNQSTNPILLTADGQTNGPSVLTDMWWHRLRSTGISDSFFFGTRLTGPTRGVVTSGAGAEPQGDAGELKGFDQMTGVEVGPNGTFYYSSGAAGNRTHISYYLRRAPGFFDITTWVGTGSARTVSHNLGVAPEMMLVKNRSSAFSWSVYHSATGATKYLTLNTNVAPTTNAEAWNDTAPTSSVLTVKDDGRVNASGDNHIGYLFASVDGISKVGSYSGTGSDVNVDCGFSSGARFILIKRSDSTGDWYVWDSARGIVAGNDPYVLMNTNAAETTGTDYIDPLSSGFTVTSSASAELNASGGTYIFLAIA